MDSQYADILRAIIAEAYKDQDFESLTLKRVRAAAETRLGLEDGFFKSNDYWKDRSKDVVNKEVVFKPAVSQKLYGILSLTPIGTSRSSSRCATTTKLQPCYSKERAGLCN